ncbi:MAG: hypothetical protein WCS31_14610 [Verrucomicrobiae bacterium]
MKALIPILFCMLPVAVRSDEPAVTAQELAHHLGIATWTSSFRLPGFDLGIQILHIKNGKVADAILGDGAFPTDREFTRVAIEASHTSGGTRFSLQTGGGPSLSVLCKASIPLDTIVPLPSNLAAGDYVLGGDIPDERLKQDLNQLPLTIKEIKEGVLLRVTTPKKN